MRIMVVAIHIFCLSLFATSVEGNELKSPEIEDPFKSKFYVGTAVPLSGPPCPSRSCPRQGLVYRVRDGCGLRCSAIRIRSRLT